MAYEQLKRLLQVSFELIAWEPTPDELKEIARRIRAEKPQTTDELGKIADSVHPFGLQAMFEGITNTDLDTVLLMATRLAQPK